MWDEAAQPADEGVQLCETHGHNAFARYFLYIQAILGAARGQADEAEATAERIIRRAMPKGASRAAHHGHHAAAVAAPGHGDFAGAYEHTNAAGPAGSPASTQLRAAGWSRRPAETSKTHTLTPQELETARPAACGLTNKQTAKRLFLSHRTAGAHLYQIYPKLGITSRAMLRDARAHARRRGPGPQRVGQELPPPLQGRMACQVTSVHGTTHHNQSRQVRYRRQTAR
ncbi:LuxR C-terminal-related transcriptional regulator [Streptomyces sp. NPDC056653]|uniref:helix-turn-helix transcriptional regulator n=1 Tax=Streptomyces sp. NPDC056653 TaxID=3345894 RepID=UPI0036786BE1